MSERMLRPGDRVEIIPVEGEPFWRTHLYWGGTRGTIVKRVSSRLRPRGHEVWLVRMDGLKGGRLRDVPNCYLRPL